MAPMMPWLSLLHLISVSVDLINFQLSITKNGDLKYWNHGMTVSSFKKCVVFWLNSQIVLYISVDLYSMFNG